MPPPPQPHLGHAAGGAGSRGAPRARNGHTTALFAYECQSFLDNVIAGLGQIGAWNDPRSVDFLRRFGHVIDKDGVLGTHGCLSLNSGDLVEWTEREHTRRAGKVCPNGPLWANSDFYPRRRSPCVHFAGQRFGNKLADWTRDTPIGIFHGSRRAWPHRFSSMDSICPKAPEVRSPCRRDRRGRHGRPDRHGRD